MNSITVLNRSAIEYLHKKSYHQALQTFKEALRIVRLENERGEVESGEQEDTATSCNTRVLPIVANESQCDPIDCAPSNTYFSLYSWTFAFTCHSDTPSEVDSSTIASTILFNMALTLHCQALRSGESQNLAKATNVYKISLQVLQRYFDSTTAFDEEVMVLYAAILNNMGHISSLMMMKDETNWCLEQLKIILPHIPTLECPSIEAELESIRLTVSVATLLDSIMDCAPAA
jgi:hypothetical protein